MKNVLNFFLKVYGYICGLACTILGIMIVIFFIGSLFVESKYPLTKPIIDTHFDYCEGDNQIKKCYDKDNICYIVSMGKGESISCIKK